MDVNEIVEDLRRALKDAHMMACEKVTFRDIPIKNVQTVVDALELQIPMKPELRADGYADGELAYDEWVCPRCGAAYELEYDEYACCPNCYQRIDWEDEK